MNYYYFYRMTCDTGNAPCVFNNHYAQTNLLTLACCKGGQIRNYNGKINYIKTGLRHIVAIEMQCHPQDNFYVIGLLKDRIVYIAKIKKAIPMAQYFSEEKYKNRMDCIYRLEDTDKNWKLKRRKNFNPLFHCINDIEQHHHDELGEYVLLSEEFIYQGNNTELKINDRIKGFMPKRQETKKYCDNAEIAHFVETYMKIGNKKAFIPTERLDERNCKSKGCQK